MPKAIRTFGFSAVATLLIWVATAWGMGLDGLIAVVVLTFLEITFSFDNAVVNAKLLGFLSPWWQRFFMTFGIFVAVFVVRFALPVVIVAMTTGLGLVAVANMAFNQPELYGHELEKAAPAIDSFGGVFLLMIAAGFFLDALKDVHWFGWLERRLSALGRYDNVAIFTLALTSVAIAATMPGEVEERFVVLVAATSGIVLNIGLGIFGAVMDGDNEDEEQATPVRTARVLVGGAAFFMFLRLEVLDASFSFDGVIGAFALSDNVIVIMAGLGAGALWVRSLTVQLVRAGTLAKYRYLEHGAHWAIGALGTVMLLKVYQIEPPQWFTGSLGLAFVGLAVWSSLRHRRQAVASDQ